MNMLLVPIIPVNEDTNTKDTPFIGVYNFDPSNVLLVEPDEDGDTTIAHRHGFDVTLRIDTADFIKIIKDSNLLNLYFLNQCKDVDKHIEKRLGLVARQPKTPPENDTTTTFSIG